MSFEKQLTEVDCRELCTERDENADVNATKIRLFFSADIPANTVSYIIHPIVSVDAEVASLQWERGGGGCS